MKNVDEFGLLKSVCAEKPGEAQLIKDLLRINKETSLQMRKRGIREQVETKIDHYLKTKKL